MIERGLLMDSFAFSLYHFHLIRLFGEHPLLHDTVLESENSIKQGFRGWRTSRHINIDGYKPVDALDNAIAVINISRSGTGPHGYDVFRFWHLIVNFSDDRGHSPTDSACHNHQIRLARRGPKHTSPVAINVISGRCCCDHLNSAAGQTKGHGP